LKKAQAKAQVSWGSGLAKRSEGGTLKQGEEGDPLQEPDPEVRLRLRSG